MKQSLSADIVNYLRNTRNLSDKQISELAGVSVSYISYVRKGQRAFTLNRITQIADALNIQLSRLIACIERTKLSG